MIEYFQMCALCTVCSVTKWVKMKTKLRAMPQNPLSDYYLGQLEYNGKPFGNVIEPIASYFFTLDQMCSSYFFSDYKLYLMVTQRERFYRKI